MSGDYTEGAPSAVDLRERTYQRRAAEGGEAGAESKVSSILSEALDCPKAISA